MKGGGAPPTSPPLLVGHSPTRWPPCNAHCRQQREPTHPPTHPPAHPHPHTCTHARGRPRPACIQKTHTTHTTTLILADRGAPRGGLQRRLERQRGRRRRRARPALRRRPRRPAVPRPRRAAQGTSRRGAVPCRVVSCSAVLCARRGTEIQQRLAWDLTLWERGALASGWL